MKEKYSKDADAKAWELADQWREKNNTVSKLRQEMKELKEEMCKFAKLSVGDVILEKKTGKKHVVDSVDVIEWNLKGGVWEKEPEIAFEYSTRPLKKDGGISMNHSSIFGDLSEDEFEITGEKIEIN
jgi:hypothetical protein